MNKADDKYESVLELLKKKHAGELEKSFRQLASETGMALSTLHLSSKILRYFNNDIIAFIDDYKKRGRAFTVYARYKAKEIEPPPEIKTSPFERVDEKVSRYFENAYNPNRETEANKIIHRLRHFIRPDRALRDKYFISYSDCVCCGAPSYGEEFPLRRVEDMLMPICETCFDLPNYLDKIRWKAVAGLYYGYSQVIEEASDYYTELL